MDCYFMDRPGKLRLATAAIPRIREGEILLETECVTICATDVAYWRGEATPLEWPFIPCHEYVGRVVESRVADSGIEIGARLTYWGQTDFFGLARFRAIRPVLAEPDERHFFTSRHFMDDTGAAVAEVDDSIEPHHAPLVEPLTAVLRLLDAHPPRPGERVLLLGAGTCGLLAVQALRTLCVDEIVVLESNAHRRQVAVGLGASRGLHPVQDAAELAEMQRDSFGSRFDLVIDLLPDIAQGVEPCPRSLAMRLLRPGGRYLLFGAPERPQLLNHWLILAKGLSLHAAGFDVRHFPMWRTGMVMRRAIELMRSGLVAAQPLVTHVVSFSCEDAVAEAFDQHGVGERLKTAVLFN